jgi:hypothetical protein
VGDAGVGGGGFGDISLDATVEIGSRESCGDDLGLASISVSVSEPEASSSQLSATGFDFGLWAGFWGTVAESLRCVSVDAISVEPR